jgi:alpha-beta hydrolase superfamily lysophospholipase
MTFGRFATRAAAGTVKQALRTLFYGLIGGTIALVVVAVIYLDSRPDLKIWHTADLDEEFTAKSDITSFADYLALEKRLFKQLNEEVYDKLAPEDRRQINRYHRGSLADPTSWPKDWNRSYEVPANKPRIGVLLLHGLSDSPYSLRHLGQRLRDEGAWVVGMRVPGHGTAPVGLVDTDWQDMAAAVKIAVRHLRERIGDQPLFIVGYSNGGALAVHYALTALQDDTLAQAQGLVLLSPEIGITKLAALAVWQERLGHLLGMEKLAWNSIQPEYDPYKYNSFALNAGKQAYELTEEIQSKITRLGSAGKLQNMPPIIAFQSVVDATVTAPALVAGLFERLPKGQHELVLYDINRFTEIEPILTSNPTAWIDNMLRGQQHDYVITLITNKKEDSRLTVARQLKANEHTTIDCDLDLKWPRGFYSLSHVALPFPPDDPVYGGVEVPGYDGIQLGQVALRGERGVLQISEADLMRLRWNPFYAYQEQRIREFMGLVGVRDLECTA